MNYEQTLIELAKKDDRVVILTAENRALIRTIPEALGERFIDTGITEQTLIGVAAGLALRGRRPIVHALAAFLTMRAFEFVRTDLGIAQLPVKLVGYIPGLLSEANGPTHQAIEDIALMRTVPGMQIFVPADEADLALSLPSILASNKPSYIRYNGRKSTFTHSPYQFGKAEVVHRGREIALITYGTLFQEALEAANEIIKKGISVRFINLRSLHPIDEVEIASALRECSLTVTVEDHIQSGALYSMVCELAVRKQLRSPVYPIALSPHGFVPALFSKVIELEKMTGPALASRILRTWAQERVELAGPQKTPFEIAEVPPIPS